MKVLIAPLELKGTLNAGEAARALREGFGAGFDCELLPLADGGPGTLDCLPGSPVEVRVTASDGSIVDAHWLSADRVAVIESAKATSLVRVAPALRRPMHFTSRGVGEMIRAALDAGERRIAVALGGTGTVDMGLGCAAALGVRFLDAAGDLVEPVPGNFSRIERVDSSAREARWTRLEVWLDVAAPLAGEAGTVMHFGGQKGLRPEEMPGLDAQFVRLAEVIGAGLVDGDGAGGGLGYGLRALLGAQFRSGFDAIADVVGVDAALQRADVVVTAEGAFDAQSLQGKGPWSLAKRAHALGKPVVLFCGACKVERSVWRTVLRDVVTLGPPPASADVAGQTLIGAARGYAGKLAGYGA